MPASIQGCEIRFWRIEIKGIKVGNDGEMNCKKPHALFVRSFIVDWGGIREIISMFGQVGKFSSVSFLGVELYTEGATFLKPIEPKHRTDRWLIERITVDIVDFEGPLSRNVNAFKGWLRKEYHLENVEGSAPEIANRVLKNILHEAMEDHGAGALYTQAPQPNHF